MKKVLIACPTADVKDYCLEDFIDNIKSFTYHEKKLFLCDNSETRDYYIDTKKKYSFLGDFFEMARVTPSQYRSFKIALAKSHNKCRLKALEDGYDYLLHLESDVFPPIDVIERLLAHKKPIVGALYHIETGERSTLMIQQLEEFGDAHRETNNLWETDLEFVNGEVKKIFSCGLGCVLIHRSVLEKVQFRCDENSPVHPDSFFYNDLDAKGIDVYVDTSIYCEHRNQVNQRF